jgi:hypothetical protein
MSHFEDDLREALRRREPTPDFSQRVLERIASRSVVAGKVRGRSWRWPSWAPVAVAACVLVSILGSFEYRNYRAGQRAKQELVVALHIAGSKLNLAQKKVLDLSQRTLYE